MKVSGIIKQLKVARDQAEKQLSGIDAALVAFVGVYGGKVEGKATRKPARKRRKISAKGIAAIRRAQKARWAKVKRGK